MTAALDAWHEFIDRNDPSLLDGLVAEDAVFHSPVVFAPQKGKALVIKYLAAANKVLNNGAFRYVGNWNASNSVVLQFAARIDDVEIDGADFISWNDDGKISEFKVMLRPLKAINLVLQRMGEELARV